MLLNLYCPQAALLARRHGGRRPPVGMARCLFVRKSIWRTGLQCHQNRKPLGVFITNAPVAPSPHIAQVLGLDGIWLKLQVEICTTCVRNGHWVLRRPFICSSKREVRILDRRQSLSNPQTANVRQSAEMIRFDGFWPRFITQIGKKRVIDGQWIIRNPFLCSLACGNRISGRQDPYVNTQPAFSQLAIMQHFVFFLMIMNSAVFGILVDGKHCRLVSFGSFEVQSNRMDHTHANDSHPGIFELHI